MQPNRATSTRATAATLLSVLACVALMLEQVRVPFHLALNDHCISHSTADCDSGHGHDHTHDSRPESPASHHDLHHPGDDLDEHCSHSLEDHFGELPLLAPQPPSDHVLLALAPTPPHLMPTELPLNGVKLDTACAHRKPPPPQKTAPRGPPSLV